MSRLRSTWQSLLVNLHYKLAVWIDAAAIHSSGVEWQSDIALTIDCDQSTRSAKLRDLVQSGLRGLFERHPAIFHQRRNIAPNRRPDKIFTVTCRGNGARRIICVSSCADDRRVANAPRQLVGCSAG